MKKLISIILSVFCLLTLVACNRVGNSEDTTPVTSTDHNTDAMSVASTDKTADTTSVVDTDENVDATMRMRHLYQHPMSRLQMPRILVHFGKLIPPHSLAEWNAFFMREITNCWCMLMLCTYMIP